MAIAITPGGPLPPGSAVYATEELDPLVPFWTDVWRRFRRNKLALIGLGWCFLLIFIAVAAPIITFFNPTTINVADSLAKPSRKHWFGTDILGRDLYTRIVYGSQISLKVAIATIIVTIALSLFVGAMSGFFGGWFDTIFMRLADIFSALPYIVVVLFFVGRFGRKLWAIVAAIVVIGWMGTARLFRSGVLQVKAQEYIEAARAAGCSNSRIILRHILPNAIQPIIVSIAFSIGGAILQESVFSFLGVGFQPPTPAWGIMVGESRDYITSAPHLFFFPAGALVLTVLAFTFIGDGMRDALDPKLRGAT